MLRTAGDKPRINNFDSSAKAKRSLHKTSNKKSNRRLRDALNSVCEENVQNFCHDCLFVNDSKDLSESTRKARGK